MTIDLVEPRVEGDAFLFTPFWREYSEFSPREGCVVARGQYLLGRVAWFTFMPETVQGRKDNSVILDRLIGNTIGWLHGQPLVNVKVWPRGFQAGGALALEARGSGELISYLASGVTRYNVTFDLIVDGEYFPTDVSLASIPHGDVILKSEESRRTKILGAEELRGWMTRSADKVKKFVGERPVGFFPADWS